MDVDEFMAFYQTRPDGEHWELIDGVAVMMAPPSYRHQWIVRNLCELLNHAFETNGLDFFACFDAGVRAPAVRNFQPEPDVVVRPGDPGDEIYAEDFRLAAEVLSPSNTRAEVELKLRFYREAPDNLYVVVIEPREFLVEIHARRADWKPVRLTKADDAIVMPEFALSCRVADLYRRTPLDPHRKGTAR
jgi:Uma2 family endonuclease